MVQGESGQISMPYMWMCVRCAFLNRLKVFFEADWMTRKQLWHVPNCVCKQLKWGYCGYIFYLTYFGRLGISTYLRNIEWERDKKNKTTRSIYGIQFGWIANSCSQKKAATLFLRLRMLVIVVYLSEGESRKRPQLMQLLWNHFLLPFTFFRSVSSFVPFHLCV